MEIKVTQAEQNQMKPKPADESQLGFGDIVTDHIYKMDWETGKGWSNPRIEPYGPIPIDPAAMVLHYGQEVFEGLKAYTAQDGGINLFRPEENFKRINRSAERLCMPEVDVDLAMEGMKKLILLDRGWIPKSEGTSLYIRPTMIATEPHLGVRPARTYLFYIIIGPVGAYYKEGLNPVKIHVEDFFVRAAIGGTGEAKTSGNYASSLLAAEEAKKKGFTQVLWLDAAERKYVEEVGTMNMFFVIDGEVIGEVKGRNVIMCDDMISTAGTVCGAAKLLKERGAKNIIVGATHGVFVGPAIARIDEAPFDEVIVTDTIPLNSGTKNIKNLKVLSVAELLGEAIKRIHSNESVSIMFKR